MSDWLAASCFVVAYLTPLAHLIGVRTTTSTTYILESEHYSNSLKLIQVNPKCMQGPISVFTYGCCIVGWRQTMAMMIKMGRRTGKLRKNRSLRCQVKPLKSIVDNSASRIRWLTSKSMVCLDLFTWTGVFLVLAFQHTKLLSQSIPGVTASSS